VTPMALEMRLAMIKAFLMRKRAIRVMAGSSKGGTIGLWRAGGFGMDSDVSGRRLVLPLLKIRLPPNSLFSLQLYDQCCGFICPHLHPLLVSFVTFILNLDAMRSGFYFIQDTGDAGHIGAVDVHLGAGR